MRSLLLIVFFMNLGISQDKYPADTLLRSSTSNILEKATILPISAWQRLSYNSVLLSCQFYPSCSNYGGLAISEHGPFVGLAITADRIVRCSPFALEYHYDMNGEFHYPDYRLIDPLQITNTKNNSNKSPLFAAGLSMILPGSGRIYAGRFMDGLMAFPSFLLAIALVAILGPSFQNVVIALWITGIPGVVRIIRSLVLTLRESQYVEAARAIGAQPGRILFKHIFPQTVAPIVVAGTYIFANSILTEAGLSFLGTGIPPTTPSWGNQMGESRIYASISSWTIFFPGLMVALMVLAVNLVGDGLRDALDPKLRRRG